MLNLTSLRSSSLACLIFLLLSAGAVTSAARESVVLHEVRSRELVDLEWLPDGRLAMLVTEPRAERPGLYLFRTDAPIDERLEHHCPLEGAAHFSFDRRHILIRSKQPGSFRLSVLSLSDCKPAQELVFELPILDADADPRWIALALRSEDGQARIELYDRRGRKRASAPTDRQVELGLAASGNRLLNFDRASHGPRVWLLPDLVPSTDPNHAVPTPLPGSRASKLESPSGQASVLLPGGKGFRLEPHERVRAASREGRYLLTHRNDGQHDRLDWIDTQLARRETLARRPSGAIDHAAVRADGQFVAWTERAGDQVLLRVLDRRDF